MVRGIRGAITVEKNEKAEIIAATQELLRTMIQENKVVAEDIAAIIFSSTPDINSAFPAASARGIGLSEVPVFGTQEIDNPDGLPRCVRVLMLVNTDIALQEIKHVYLRAAITLRPDLTESAS
ncbi:MAG: chorismate mutase [Firmicutes bacterium]|nr:chorismate mutase [Bacillota bacterium]